MAYQALYRTWRPQRFSDVVGQDRIVTTLKNQIRLDRIPHAYLFCGSRGTGKTSTARILSRAVNCGNLQDGEPCGECPACRAIEQESCLDVVEIDAASNTGVDNVRDLIEKISFPPVMCRYKIYIIDEVHMLSPAAFNALLKTLEEPPAYVLFILATTDPQKLPATVLSRCQRFDFGRIPADVIESRLRGVADSLGVTAEGSALHDIAMAAEGGMRDALSLMDMCLSYEGESLTEKTVRAVLGTSERGFLFTFAQCLIDGDAAKAFSLIDELMRAGRDPAVFAREITAHVRSLMVARLGGEGLDTLLNLTREDAQRLKEQAQGAQPARLTRLMDLFMQAESDMKWSSQPRAVLELCAVRGCRPERESGDEALEDRLQTLEKAVEQGLRTPAAEAVAPKPKAAADKPEAPRPEPGAKPTVSAADDELYQQGLKAIGKQDPRTWTLMNKGRFGGVTDDTVRLVFDPKGAEQFITLLSGAERAAFIDERMSEAFGRRVHLRPEALQAAPAGAINPDNKPNLERLLDVFPRDKVELTD